MRARRAMRRGPPGKPAHAFDRAVAEFFMRLALAEARRGLGRTSPNPAVGAVLVKNGRVIARGFHAKAGGPHAEIVALRRAGARARGADLYSTLEPCNHWGKTPPCTEAIIAAGIRRVVVGCQDLNPVVSGRGARRLRAAGIPVLVNVLREECEALNAPFFTFITERRPYVTLKVAATLDGRIATSVGDSRWVSGERSRERVHGLRNCVDAVLVGAGTVRADDPQLTARPRGRLARRQPMRVVLSASLDFPATARIFDDARGRVLVLTSSADGRKAAALEARGAEVVRIAGDARGVNLKAALRALAERNVVHLLVEGGGEVFGQFLEHRLADELWLFVAPKVLGEGIAWARLPGPERMAQALSLGRTSVEQVGEDVLIRAKL